VRLLDDTRRRVGRLAPKRAEPIGADAIRIEIPDDPVRLLAPPDGADAVVPPAGVPQTLQ
jgi:hypothetical protein